MNFVKIVWKISLAITKSAKLHWQKDHFYNDSIGVRSKVNPGVDRYVVVLSWRKIVSLNIIIQ